jgi:dihydroneopterin aldolase
LGNDFLVSIKVGIATEKIESIQDTVNYVTLQAIIENEFLEPTELLETLAFSIHQKVLEQFSINYFWLSIKKLHPPLNLPTESSEIILENFYD